MVKKMHMRLRRTRTRRKTRGGRISSRTRSRSPSGIRIISTRVPVPILQQTPEPQQLVMESVNEPGPIGRELWNFKVKCGNGEEHTSPHLYTRMAARSAAREYCSARGGVDGRIEYTVISR